VFVFWIIVLIGWLVAVRVIAGIGLHLGLESSVAMGFGKLLGPGLGLLSPDLHWVFGVMRVPEGGG
jgi:hypothetical protein